MSAESSFSWPQKPLSGEALAVIRKGKWRRFGTETVIVIAQAWDAGMSSSEIAAQLGCSTQTIAMTIGRVNQFGVSLRRAVDSRAAHGKPPSVLILGASIEGEKANTRRLAARARAPQRQPRSQGNVTGYLLGDPAPGRTPWAVE